MWGYWRKVIKIAFKRAAELVGFGSAERAVITVALQTAIALLIYLLLGATELRDNAGVRLITAVAPLAVFPMIFLWKMLAVPAALHKEQLSEEDRERRMQLLYLANMYVNEVKTPDAAAINNGLLNPPEDWVNGRLEAYGFNWRARFSPGAKVEFYVPE